MKMARHRNIRAMDYDEEYEGYYSCYGHSVEDDSCISPHTESQFLYDRKDKNHCVSSFLKFQPTTEEEEGDVEENYFEGSSEQSCNNFTHDSSCPLSDIDKGKMLSCVEAMQDVVGDTIPEFVLIKAACDNSFVLEKSLKAVLSGPYTNSVSNNEYQASKSATKIIQKIDKLSINVANESKISFNAIKVSDNKRKLDIEKEDKLGDEHKNEVSNDPKTSDIAISLFTSSEKPNVATKDHSKLYEKERKSEKPLLNLVVIGHVDAGKSTLMGHMLYDLGFVPKKSMHKYAQDSKKLGKASFMYAWVLDETSEERNRGITMDVAQSKFETPHRTVNLLDAPGHKDFIPNMIAGAAQADVAILVVDSTQGEFETGFEAGGQTREHTMLIRSLGVSQLAVAVNKMDNVNWDMKRHDNIVRKLSAFLKQVGFKEKDIQFVPCSGLTGENVSEPLDCNNILKNWYKGPTLLDVIDSFKTPEREVSKPLRMCISDIFKGTGSGFCVSGKIESGCVQNGDKILIMPTSEAANIRGISINDISAQHGFAGDHVILQLTSIDMNNLSNGSVICDINTPIPVSTRFQARLVIFNVAIPITKGFSVILHYQNLTEQAIIKKLISQLHRGTGEILKKHPRCLTKNSNAIVEIEVSRPICVELYRDYKELGRFMLRSAGCTIAAGLITEIK